MSEKVVSSFKDFCAALPAPEPQEAMQSLHDTGVQLGIWDEAGEFLLRPMPFAEKMLAGRQGSNEFFEMWRGAYQEDDQSPLSGAVRREMDKLRAEAIAVEKYLGAPKLTTQEALDSGGFETRPPSR